MYLPLFTGLFGAVAGLFLVDCVARSKYEEYTFLAALIAFVVSPIVVSVPPLDYFIWGESMSLSATYAYISGWIVGMLLFVLVRLMRLR